MTDTATSVAEDCAKCAEYYGDKPGHAGHLTMVDLYRAIHRLAKIVERQVDEIDELRAALPKQPR